MIRNTNARLCSFCFCFRDRIFRAFASYSSAISPAFSLSSFIAQRALGKQLGNAIWCFAFHRAGESPRTAEGSPAPYARCWTYAASLWVSLGGDEPTLVLDLAEWRNGRTVQHLPARAELRAVARAIPALLQAVPVNDATRMRTALRSSARKSRSRPFACGFPAFATLQWPLGGRRRFSPSDRGLPMSGAG